MRMLVITPTTPQLLPIVDSVLDALKAFDEYEIDTYATNIFYLNCTYFQRRLYKLGYKADENKYNQSVIEKLDKKCSQFQPDFILVLNGANVPVPVQKFLAGKKTILWLWDSFRRGDLLGSFVNFAAEIFCFEYADIEFLAKKNISAHYLPLGVDTKTYFPAECERDIDVSFVGTPFKERIALLNRVCERALQKNWKVKIGGPFYDTKHFWKKFLFKYRRAYLQKFLDNRIFLPTELAELYSRSKICLNINTAIHKSLSPRTFEICATKSFQLMNSGQISHGLMNLDTDLATFDGAEDLLEKIQLYLENETLRNKIALDGYNSVMKNCTLQKLIEKLLAESKIIREL